MGIQFQYEDKTVQKGPTRDSGAMTQEGGAVYSLGLKSDLAHRENY